MSNQDSENRNATSRLFYEREFLKFTIFFKIFSENALCLSVFFSCSQMIEICSLTTTACRNCDNALSMDYYEMLMLKKDVETEMKDVLQLLCEIDPVTKADLGCQFPNHEKLLASIRSCAKLVLRKCM